MQSTHIIWTWPTILSLIIGGVGLGLSIWNTYCEHTRRVCKFSIQIEGSNVGMADPWVDHVRILVALLVMNEAPEPFSVTYMRLVVGGHPIRSSSRVSCIVPEDVYQYTTDKGARVGPKEPAVYTSALPAELAAYGSALLHVEFLAPADLLENADTIVKLTVYTNRGKSESKTFDTTAMQCELSQLVGIMPLDIK